MDVTNFSVDGVPINISDEQAREDITEIKSNLIDNDIDDTGWTDIATYYRYRKKNGIVFVEKYISTSVQVTNTYTTLFTLPEGYRPSYSGSASPCIFMVTAASQAQGIDIRVESDGKVQASAQFGSNTPSMYTWSISFVVD